MFRTVKCYKLETVHFGTIISWEVFTNKFPIIKEIVLGV